jgi:nucleotide-binding universal stress UspA family protein
VQFRKILVGVDGSRNSDRAASIAGDIAELAGAEVLAIHVIGLLEGRPDPEESRVEHRRSIARLLETRWTEVLRRTGTRVRCELHDGNATTVLLSVAADYGADLIVVGRRGHGSFPEQVLGSTSAAVAATAHCPVLVIPDDPASD